MIVAVGALQGYPKQGLAKGVGPVSYVAYAIFFIYSRRPLR
jgi:hypothetical protein